MVAERVLMVLLLGSIALGCAVILQPFVSAMLWAAILVYTTWPLAEWLRRRARLGRGGSALAMVGLVGVVIAVPLWLAAPAGASDILQLRAGAERLFADLPPAPLWLHRVPLVGHELSTTWNAVASDLTVATGYVRPYFGMIAETGLRLLVGIANGVLQFMLALVIAYFFWYSGDILGAYLRRILRRIAGPSAEPLMLLAGRTVRGTVIGILGTAILQGFLTAFGLSLAGVPRVVLLGATAAFLAVLPIGAPLVWIPAGLWLFAVGRDGAAVFLLVYGTVVVSGADHVIRPYFISRGARLPFLLTALGVLGGILSFGALGIFLGPALIGIGYALVVEFARGERDPRPPEFRPADRQPDMPTRLQPQPQPFHDREPQAFP